MAQTLLETHPGLVYAPLVTFTWGMSNVVRYCRWTSDLVIDGQTFTHCPSLKVLMDKPQHGGTEDSPIEVQMLTSLSPFDKLSEVFPHAPVHCVVEEVSPGDDTTRQELFSGRVGKTRVRLSRQSQLTTCTIQGPKARLKARVGIQALSTCNWWLGHPACGYDLEAEKITGVIDTVSPSSNPARVVITLDDPPPDMSPWRWNRGFLEVDGCRITIRRLYETNLYTLDLREIPPPDWLNAAVTLAPGCDKKIQTCRLHDREESFSGYGYGMPTRNPLFTAS